jgi:hypothetical protein
VFAGHLSLEHWFDVLQVIVGAGGQNRQSRSHNKEQTTASATHSSSLKDYSSS